ncbi:FecR family protein [Pedobacter sp. N23S346]|uniref:FecR family protein n=1 Tax=Pedobacter sp. N23S346 TaxID=3402750 RepID=UPI003ACEDAF7
MKPNRRKFLIDQLTGYQFGKLDDKRKAIIDKWFDREAEKHISATQKHADSLGEEIFSSVLSRIQVDKPKSKNFLYISSAAAAIMLFISVAIVMRNRPVVSVEQKPIAYTTYQTAQGQEKKIKLSDGTWVSLKPGSSFRVPSDLVRNAIRKVYLDRGEAFFSVKRDTLHPFMIRSGKFLTTVLGTSFTITTFPEHKSYKVAVKTGKVRVERMDGKTRNLLSACLTKGKELNYNEMNKVISISETSGPPVEKLAAEVHHANLQMTLTEIGGIIGEKYNLTVKVKPQQPLRKYAVKLDYENLEQTLNELAMQTGMRYEIDNKLLTITPGL